jgi:hypothetical protein
MSCLSHAPQFGGLIMLYSDSGVIVLSKNGLYRGKAQFIIEYEMHPTTYSKREKAVWEDI